MISERIEKKLNIAHVCKLLVIDTDRLSGIFDYASFLARNGFRIVPYTNVEAFRAEYEETIRMSEEQVAVIVSDEMYIPYDIQKSFRKSSLALAAMFPLLHADTLAKYMRDIDFVSFAYDFCYANASSPAETESFIENTVYSAETIKAYCAERNALLAEYAVEYPGHYLDKSYRYFICKPGVSFDSKGETVMTHGGMTLDEVIVPFVEVKEVH
jgi:hypothetical protein